MNKQEAIEYIQEWFKDEYALNGKDRIVLNMAIKALQQERPKGEWQITINQDYRCSNCNKITSSYKANFCPYCGADMRKKEREDG